MRYKAMFGFMESIKKNLMPKFNMEVEKVIPEWKELRSYHDENIAVHTLGVIYCAIQDPEY